MFTTCSGLQYSEDFADFAAQLGWVGGQWQPLRLWRFFLLRGKMIQAAARTADGETFFIQQLADTTDEQHFMMLVVAPVSAPFDRFKLGKFLLPVTQHMRLYSA